MSYIAQGLNNYTKTYSNKRTGFSVGYYTVSQVKALYPQGDYQLAAQIGAGVKKNAPEEEHCLAMDFAAGSFAGADFWHTVCGESLG